MRNYGVKTQTLKIYIKSIAFQGSETKNGPKQNFGPFK